MNWSELGFTYRKTPYNVRCVYRDGKWGELEVCSSEYINMHMSAACLHYGQEAFEGLKAFRGEDGQVRLFRVEENAKRMMRSADCVEMAQPSVELFVSAVKKAVELNIDFVPPYETGASLYIRPLLIGTEPVLGVKPSNEYTFIVFVSPVGNYFSGGESLLEGIVLRNFDRAGAHGTGHVKVGGNYASSYKSAIMAKKKGYGAVIYLDPVEKKYIDECGAANLFGIKGNTYVTPASSSILPSITNDSLRQVARDLGMTVEERKIPLEELAEFDEVGACGTAAVITKVGKIVDPDKNVEYTYSYSEDSICSKLFNAYRAIQLGKAEDKHGWITIL